MAVSADGAAQRARQLKGIRILADTLFEMCIRDSSSLNPRMSVGAMLKEVLQVHHVCPKDEMDARVAALLEICLLYTSRCV